MRVCVLFDGTRSIGLPHKEAVVACCDEVDPLAKVKNSYFSISQLYVRDNRVT